MKKILLLSIFLLLSPWIYGQIQYLTIHNMTTCKVTFYSGNVFVDGNPYHFGSEVLDASIVLGGDSRTFSVDGDIGLELPDYTGPQSTPTQPLTSVVFEGFKLISENGGGSAYIAFNQPYSLSSPVSCHSNAGYTVVWVAPLPGSDEVIVNIF